MPTHPTHPSHYEPAEKFEDSHGGRSKGMPEPAVTTSQAAAAVASAVAQPLRLVDEMRTVKDRYGLALTRALIQLAGAEKVVDVPLHQQEYLLSVAHELNEIFENGKPVANKAPGEKGESLHDIAREMGFLADDTATSEKPTGPYAELKRVFDQAFTGQTEGKAKARHNKTGILPFEQQRIMTISEMQNSPYGLTYQVTKKMLEALDMDEVEKTLHELQGVMVYVGALILFVERRELCRKSATMRPLDFSDIGD